MSEGLNRREYTRAEIEEIADRFRTWGQWGPDDQLGAANRVTATSVAAAARLVRVGVVFSLALPMDRYGPQVAGSPRANPQHMLLANPKDRPYSAYPRQGFSDDAIFMPLQASTQWDAFCHFFYDGAGYNGRGEDSVTARGGAAFNSITNLKDRAVGRGVLLDIARWKGRAALAPGEAIQNEDLICCAEEQGVEVGSGDFLLVRTGQLEECRAKGNWGDYAGGPAPGLGVSTAEFLCSRQVTGVALDTWGIEALPYECPDVLGPLHVILLVHAGVYIGEMWDMESLAVSCAQDGVYEFFLVAQPLTITGAVGSPVNPIAIK